MAPPTPEPPIWGNFYSTEASPSTIPNIGFIKEKITLKPPKNAQNGLILIFYNHNLHDQGLNFHFKAKIHILN